jgi:sugar/nucleoside kinase (ribokinase family)
MILAVGEALVEFRREPADGRLAEPGSWAGPFPSGAPAIFASVAARLGAPTALVGCVGDDAFGDAFRERLRRDGVSEEGIRVDAQRATATAFVSYHDDGTRSFWFSVPDSAAVELDPQQAQRLAERADWLHVSGSTIGFGGTPARVVEEAAATVLERGGRISLDPNVRADADRPTRERVARLARVAHVLLPSEGELAALGLDAEDLARNGRIICETRGRAGARVFGGPVGLDPVPVPIAEQDEVDPTGAGDTFAAALVTALRDGVDEIAATSFACETAAQSVGVLGAMEAPIAPRSRTMP